MTEQITPRDVVRQLRDMAQFKGDSLSPDDIERIATSAADTIEALLAAQSNDRTAATDPDLNAVL